MDFLTKITNSVGLTKKNNSSLNSGVPAANAVVMGGRRKKTQRKHKKSRKHRKATKRSKKH